MSQKRRAEKIFRLELRRSEAEIATLQMSLDEAYANFNNTADPDNLEACIHEISALRSRYNTALKHYKNKF